MAEPARGTGHHVRAALELMIVHGRHGGQVRPFGVRVGVSRGTCVRIAARPLEMRFRRLRSPGVINRSDLASQPALDRQVRIRRVSSWAARVGNRGCGVRANRSKAVAWMHSRRGPSRFLGARRAMRMRPGSQPLRHAMTKAEQLHSASSRVGLAYARPCVWS
jgi:hypothetical protein